MMMMTLKEVRSTVVRGLGLTGVSVGVITPRKKNVTTEVACPVGKLHVHTVCSASNIREKREGMK